MNFDKNLAVAPRTNTSPLYLGRPQNQLSLMPSVDKNKPEVDDPKYRSAKPQLGSQFSQSTAQFPLNLLFRSHVQKQIWSTLEDEKNDVMMMMVDHQKMTDKLGAYASRINGSSLVSYICKYILQLFLYLIIITNTCIKININILHYY